MTDFLLQRLHEQDHESRLAVQQLRQGREELATTLQQTRQLRQQLVDIRAELAASLQQSFALRKERFSADAGQQPSAP